MGFRVRGLGCKVSVLACRVSGVGCRDKDAWHKALGCIIPSYPRDPNRTKWAILTDFRL